MPENKKKLAKNSLIYASFTLLQKGFAFFLIPLYTIKLSPDEYGVLGIVMAAIPFFVLIAGLSLRGSTAYFYYEYKDSDKDYLASLWGSSFTLVLIVSFLFTGTLWLAKALLLEYVFKGIPFDPYIFLALISVCTQPIYYYYQSMLKAKQEAKKAALLDFIYFVIIVGLTIVLILYFDYKAEGALLALAVSNIIFFIYSIYGASKEIRFGINVNAIKKTLNYSLPILPHNLSAWAMNLADRLIINNLSTLSLVGLFDIGAQLGKLINIVTLGVNSAYSPWFFEQIKTNKEHKITIALITEKILLFYILIGIAISWFSPEFLMIISKPAYHGAWVVVPLIAFAFVLNGFYYSFSNVYFLEKTKYLPIITLVGAVLNIAFNFALIPVYGIMGAAIASLSSKMIFVIIAYFVSQKLFFIPYRLKKMTLWFLCGLVISWLPYIMQSRVESYSIFSVIFVKALFLIAMIFPIFWINRKLVYEFVVKRMPKK
ncbi:lipopolysaccharide biosynthesis protein [Kriegella aquimaris]|uniref:Membrane protein involved in the export of O-antigen and teichoic acid n=1 Tax=Kriegella aquimaris TaxID=192904 RepID=A0A1G9QHB7_9FLAO|nr:oligosaccharide flippase family protein [Kriegella aquimaris]SDM10474.1 Membrane protein involved in the export of O-antigen and teichoic acid [Kriegella aquimaris]